LWVAVTARKRSDFRRILGSRQASILEYLWAHGPQSVAALHRGLSKKDDLAYTTVFTELSRMLQKRLVAKSSETGSHLDIRYRPAVTREALVSAFVTETFGGLLAAYGPAAIDGFVDAVAHDVAALRELRRALGARNGKKR
jgi:predicted transcriptional regulator